MEVTIKRRRKKEFTNTDRFTTAVPNEMKNSLYSLMDQGLDVHTMSRDFWNAIIEKARKGEFKDITLAQSA